MRRFLSIFFLSIWLFNFLGQGPVHAQNTPKENASFLKYCKATKTLKVISPVANPSEETSEKPSGTKKLPVVACPSGFDFLVSTIDVVLPGPALGNKHLVFNEPLAGVSLTKDNPPPRQVLV